MQVHDLKQGSEKWLQARMKHMTASEAPAMLNVSTYMNRTELLTLKKSGVAVEVDEFTQKRFDDGHQFEEVARSFAENIIEDDLFPVTGSIKIDDLNLMASFDGLTMMEDIAWEHKTLNNELRESLSNGIIPQQYHPQLEQQLMVSGANKVLFMASDGSEDNLFYVWYKSNPNLRKDIIAGWKQFQEDLKTFKPKEPVPTIETKTIENLPSLFIEAKGEIINSNLETYKETALTFINSINTEIETDEGYENAKKTVKWLNDSEKKLETTKEQILGQTATIDEAFNTIDFIKEEMRQKRLIKV